ncbi:MAG: spore coat protein CotJB [Oscillospiraceae bacterium]
MNKNDLLRQIQMYDFLVVEARLFLDTHPKNKQAIAYFNKYLGKRKEAEAQYAEKFGPILDSDFSDENSFRWVEEPWPWEMGV